MKKFLSILLTFALLTTLIPTVMVSAAEDNTITLPVTEDAPITFENRYLGESASYGGYAGGDNEYCWVRTAPGTARSYLVSKVDLSGLSEKLGTDKTVTKVEFFSYLVGDYTGGSYAVTNSINFYPASSNWDESTITYNKWVSDGYVPSIANTDTEYAVIDTNAIPVSVNRTFSAVATGATPVLTSYDITDVFKRAMSSGIKSDSQFSFFTALSSSQAYGYILFAMSEYANEAYRPYIKLTLGDIPTLNVSKKKLPETASDDFSLKFSNNIASAKVTVNGASIADEDITIDADTLSFDYDYTAFSTYNTEVEVTDIYGQTFSKRYNFTTGNEKITGYANGTASYLISTSGTAAFSNTKKYGYVNPEDGSYGTVLYVVTMPETADGSYFDDFKFNFYLDYPSSDNRARMNLYKYYLPENTEITSLKWENISSFRTAENELTDNLSFIESKSFSLDITDYAQEVADKGNSTLYILADSDKNGSSSYYGCGGSKSANISYAISGATLLAVADKDISVAGTALKNAEITLATKVSESFLDSVALVDESGNAVTDAKFSLGTEAGTIALDSEVSLEAGKTYSIVIKAGATDELGNTLASDLTVQTFTASGNFTSSDAKILDDTFDTENGDFAQAEAKTSVSAGDSVMAVVDVNNNEASAKSLIIIIASYDADGKLSEVSIKPVSATNGAYASNAITIASTDKLVKAFAWDAATKMPVSAQTIIEVK